MPSHVSIIMPSFDSAKFIAESIDTVLAQTHEDWTLLIADDGSTDGTITIVQKYGADDKRIQYIPAIERGTGAAKTRNRALAQADGDYVAFLDSDDLWYPQKLEKQIQFMKEKDIGFSFTLFDAMDEDGNPMDKNQRGKDVVSYEDFLANEGKIGCLTAMYDRHKCGDILMPDIRKRQDYAMWLKIMKMGHKAHRMNEPLARYRIRNGGSVSSNKLDGARYMWKVYREVENLGLIKSAYYFIRYMIYHLSAKFRR